MIEATNEANEEQHAAYRRARQAMLDAKSPDEKILACLQEILAIMKSLQETVVFGTAMAPGTKASAAGLLKRGKK